MRIAQVAPLVESVPPRLYGGTERVIATLISELVAMGHELTLYASGESETEARLVPIVERALWHSQCPSDGVAFHVVELARIVRDALQFDVIHSHLDLLAFPFGRYSPTPFVHTLHGRLDLPELQEVFEEFRDAPVIAISQSQRRWMPQANWVGTVHNGLPVERIPVGAGREGYLAFLGRVSPEKGLADAIEVANRAGLPLKIAARMPLTAIDNEWVRADWKYYREQVEPRIDGDQVEFLGELADDAKYELLGNATALLFPINWPEPFGLAMIEALACGTPVIGRSMASVSEIIDHGRTGLVCRDLDEMVAACHLVQEIDRQECRREAERRFSARAMACGYLQAYDAVLNGRSRAYNLRPTTFTRGLSQPKAEPARLP